MAMSRKAKVRRLEDYLSLPYTMRVTPDPAGGYVASVEELPGCITQAESWDELAAMIHDAMRGWIALRLEDGLPVPEPSELTASTPAGR
jgi:antitoxin HicB